MLHNSQWFLWQELRYLLRQQLRKESPLKLINTLLHSEPF
jgi:hypothetical protein